MKKFLGFLIFTCILSLISSCEKDNDFPKKYVFDSYRKGTLKAYTNTGEVSDNATINNFISEHSEFFWLFEYQPDNSNFEIEIISETQAKISDSDTTISYDLVRKNGIIYFQYPKTVNGSGSMRDERLKYSPLYIREVPLTIGAPYIYIPCYYLIESNGELHMPFVSYIEKIYGSSGDCMSQQGIGNYNNVFNTDYLNKVQNFGSLVDTIVYQDNEVILKEK